MVSDNTITSEKSLKSTQSQELTSTTSPKSHRLKPFRSLHKKPKKRININQFIKSQCSVDTQAFIEEEDYEEEEMNTSDRNFVTQTNSRYDDSISMYRLVDIELDKSNTNFARRPTVRKQRSSAASTSSEGFSISYSSA